MSDKLKNTWKDYGSKEYTTIKPKIDRNLSTKIKRLVNRDDIPNEKKEAANSNEVRTYGLSSNKVVQAVQKKFTKKGKAVVQDMKLKSIDK
ncbi:hypothetical protein [uncultured Mediterranean phage uvMED]|nr:MAG: hypothetical protein CBD88_06080 [Flavobacteriales bacterium TMED228]BAQ87698.1 hypothetical protein [uncultured Mediterranean phage uvMED]